MYTDEQRKIVQHEKGHGLVGAGPGSGKTTGLCGRVQNLINKQIPAKNILLLTYSNSAAANMETKLQKEFAVNNVRCSTIHAFGRSIIMKHYRLFGFTTKPALKTKRLSKQLTIHIKKVASSNNVKPKQLRRAVYEVLRKNRNIGRIKQDADLAELVTEVLKWYQKVKLQSNWIDYADMVSLPIQLLKENKSDIRKKVMAKYKHLLVDELQDITMEEVQLIYYLAEQAESSVLVGDKKQSIYGFRGSDVNHHPKFSTHQHPKFSRLSCRVIDFQPPFFAV